MRMAIIGARWPDIEIEAETLGLRSEDIPRGPGSTRADILDIAADADVILAGPQPRFDAATIAALNCRGIVRYGVGYDNVDVEAALRKGMKVAYVPDYGTEAVALHAVTLTLAALRRITAADRMVREGRWDMGSLRPLHLPSSLTAGVIGFGRIGSRTAYMLGGLGFGTVLAYDPYAPVEESGVEPAGLLELLGRSDIVTLHLPAGRDGTPLIGAGEIARMRPGSVLVNTSRGSLIDTTALVEGLAAGTPAVAALDVFDPEPPDLGAYSTVLERIIMTPHMAWYTEESERDLRVKAAEEAGRIGRGEQPAYPVPEPGGRS